MELLGRAAQPESGQRCVLDAGDLTVQAGPAPHPSPCSLTRIMQPVWTVETGSDLKNGQVEERQKMRLMYRFNK